EHGRNGWFHVVLWPGDRQRLVDEGFTFEILVEDLVAQDIADRTAELEAQRAAPQERLMYRMLSDYENDLQKLAQENPSFVRHFTLTGTTHEGRRIHGVEIAKDVTRAATDGRPTSLICGLHHAREWPSAELTMMLAEDIVDEYKKGTARYVNLVDNVRIILLPVVNPDGFVRSRETVSDFIYPHPIVVQEFAYHRKNMRKNTTALVETGQGVDTNRNYPYMWGGTGSSGTASSQTYRGANPGSEPEVVGLLNLFRSNQVLTMITNHTYSDLVLRPWGHKAADPPDEAHLRALGNAMAAINGYTSQKGIQLYKTNGITEEWVYGAMGGYGYTFEIGSSQFHPQYNTTIPGYWSRNRDAFLLCLEAARNTAYHSVLRGAFPPGTTVGISKAVTIPLDPTGGRGTTYQDAMSSSIVVGDGGSFEWHVNPSPLPETVDQVNKGGLPESALEPYRVAVTTPDGVTRTKEIVVLRGRTYEVSFDEE
ncbi:MAG TPA: M14 family metallopeptidase, partial [Actinomycetota bacterium]|nr:M14 family metallopeptidase [Actinomycetota bacterium]